MFNSLAEGSSGSKQFLHDHVANDVDWTVEGHHPLAGHYTSKDAFVKATFGRLERIMREPGLRLVVENVVRGTEDGFAVVELKAVAVCKNGRS